MALNILDDDELLDDAETADELKIHPRTLHRWDALGNGPPFIMIGRRRFRRREALRGWLLGREQAT